MPLPRPSRLRRLRVREVAIVMVDELLWIYIYSDNGKENGNYYNGLHGVYYSTLWHSMVYLESKLLKGGSTIEGMKEDTRSLDYGLDVAIVSFTSRR